MKVAVLGTGAMGARMADRLIDAEGVEVTVWNRTAERTGPLAERGARAAATPAEAVAGADVVLSMLRDDDASAAVWLGGDDAGAGALAALAPDAVALECSTITPGWARELAERARQHGVRLLDAPLSGSLPQAETGNLVFFVGGDADALALARPVLDVLGAGTHHLGPNGAGAQVKLATNTLLTTQVAVLAEILAVLRSSDVDLEAAVGAIAATPVMSTSATGAAEGMAAGAFSPAFALALALKDLTYARVDAAVHGHAALPLLDAVAGRYRDAVEAGHGDENFTAVARLYG